MAEKQSQKKIEADEKRLLLRKVGLVSVIVSDLVGFAGGGLWIGHFAWKNWGAPIWVPFLTASTGFVLAMIQVYRLSKKEW